MSIHDAALQSSLRAFLARRAAPKSLADGEARDAEVRALFRAVSRHAPHEGELAWFERLVDHLDATSETRAWPTVREVHDAATAIAPVRVGPPVEWQADTLGIVGAKMERGEPVGEEWLYGRQAVELIAAGKVDEQTMRRYRSAAYFSRKKTYGPEAADKWEEAAQGRHDAARAAKRGAGGWQSDADRDEAVKAAQALGDGLAKRMPGVQPRDVAEILAEPAEPRPETVAASAVRMARGLGQG